MKPEMDQTKPLMIGMGATVYQQVVYAVVETTDDRGGRGETIGYFESKSVAKSMAEGRGWYGGPADVSPVTILSMQFDDKTLHYVLDRRSAEPVQLNVDLVRSAKETKEQALAKLLKTMSATELHALGINPARL